ncbi:MAG: FAD-dependent oxidoreductase [Candidatus Thermoplasmatota archaeon]|jgi:nitrite reductase (NADH) large subunit|nr:FAD-dependent oxidoreductase [Candidatus Thermoplasmatota archaeon]MDP7264499.1 FAD-dependent oxidoreductase [Candidatus Thermoplasmatota archaeon]
MKYMIIGGGCAGIEAAREIRRRDSEVKIIIIDDSGDSFIFRPALKEYLMGAIRKEELRGLPAGFFIDKRIEFLKGTVTSLDADKTLITVKENGKDTVKNYDKLLLAHGGRPNLPPYLGDRDLKNVFQFKSLGDAESIKSHLKTSKGRCMVIGGGVLGVETAELLSRMDHNVTLLSRSENLVFRGIPKRLRQRVRNLFEKNGVAILMCKMVTDIEISGDRLTGLVLDDGNLLEMDMLIACTGISPNLNLAAEAGLEISKGIHVDRTMRTSRENVFAAGDCVVLDWSSRKILRLWEPSRRMGRIAGANMTGANEVFDPYPSFYHTYLFDVPLGFFGDFDTPGEDYDRVTRKTDDGYRELVIKNNRLVGASFMGGRPSPPPFLHLMKSGKKIRGGFRQLLDDDFDIERLWYQ